MDSSARAISVWALLWARIEPARGVSAARRTVGETFMRHFIRAGGFKLRHALIGATALCAVPLAALAGDVAPTSDGAQKLSALFAQYLGKDAASIAVEGDHYAVTVDFAKLLAPLASEGVSIDIAPLKAKLVQQSDGAWRVAQEAYPPAAVKTKDGGFSVHVDGYTFDGLFDPALYGFRSAEVKMEKANVGIQTPEADETITFGPAHMTGTGAAANGGGFSGDWREEAGQMTMLVNPKKADGPQPDPVSIKAGGLSFNVTLDNMRMREALDLWAFLVAHPSRAALAADEDALKAKLRGLIPLADKFGEDIAAQNIEVDTPKGPVKLGDFKMRFGADKFPAKGDTEIRFAAGSIAPPPGIIPQGLSDLVPTAIDIDIKYGGYDYAAAAEEAISDMHLAGEGPVISDADRPKIQAKLTGGGPLVFTILPSHIVAPQLDLAVEGAFQVLGARPAGKVTVKARNFDNTFAAIKGAGQQIATPQVIAALTLAKGLGKSGADGSLIWVAEYGADGAIKVNGLALGKAPAH